MEERKQQLEAIFDGAIALESAEQREIYLARTCGQDLALRREAEALIRAYEKAGNFLTHGASEADQNSSKPDSGRIAIAAAVEEPGTVIGRYKLREKIGEGGCGVVYVAEQEEPVRRLVALKVIKLGMDTRSVVARFEAERQALAIMDHPNIAKIYDGGIVGSPHPASGHSPHEPGPLTPSLSPSAGERVSARTGEGAVHGFKARTNVSGKSLPVV
jgi:eukaryotic-like serine/threonine-protein kinase